MKIYLEEEHKTEAYQDTMNIHNEISTKLKIATNIIQNNGGKSTKLYNKSSLMKLTFSRGFFKHCKNNVNKAHNIKIYVKIAKREWIWNKDYMHKWSCFVKRI